MILSFISFSILWPKQQQSNKVDVVKRGSGSEKDLKQEQEEEEKEEEEEEGKGGQLTGFAVT